MPCVFCSPRHPGRALGLGLAFARDFATRSAPLGKGEIVLFRALQQSLIAIAKIPEVVVEEYHGAKHQVTFTGVGSYSRTQARCELSDLLVIVYDRKRQDARLTYIQAKSERSVPAATTGLAQQKLVANLEQWDLLARRPAIAGAPGPGGRAGTFRPPADLLSGALLPSVGSFVFFLHGSTGAEIYYAAASTLTKNPKSSSRNGKLVAAPNTCVCGPIPECLSVYGNAEFASCLFGLTIGTPILSHGKPEGTSNTWLASQLRGLASQNAASATGSDLAYELAKRLDPENGPAAPSPSVGAKFFLLIGLGERSGRGP